MSSAKKNLGKALKTTASASGPMKFPAINSADDVLRGIANSSPETTEPLARTRGQQAIADCKLFTLNDDCLLKIMSYLDGMDLCAVKDTCRRFKYLSEYAAQLKFIKYTDFEYSPDGENEPDYMIFMKHFGKNVTGKVTLKGERAMNVKNMWLLLKRAGPIKELEFIDVDVHGLPIWSMKKVLQNVQILQFKKCFGKDEDYARIIRACANVRSLTIFVNMSGATDQLLAIIARHPSKIEEIYFSSITFNPETFVDNLKQLRHLEHLSLLFLSCGHCPVASAIEAIAKRGIMKFILLRDIRPGAELARVLYGIDSLELCYLQTKYEMPDNIRELFAKFSDEGLIGDMFNYRFAPKNFEKTN